MARERSRLVGYSIPCMYGSTIQSLSDSGTYTHTCGETITDVVTPGYFALKKSGKPMPVNPLTMTGVKVVRDFGTWQWDWTYKSRYGPRSSSKAYSGNLCWSYQRQVPDFPALPSSSISEDVVLQEALAKARTPSFDAGTFAAELSKTMDLILGFRKRLFKTLADIRRNPKFAHKPLADAWLEYRYGWRILSYDIEEINASLAKLKEIPLGYHRYTAHESSQTSTPSVSSDSISPLMSPQVGTSAGYWFYNTSTQRVDVRAGVAVEGVARDIYFVDPLVTTWEIIPFSFILDWFFNLGEMIQAWSPFARGDVLWSFVSVRRACLFDQRADPVGFYTGSAPLISKSVIGGSSHQLWDKYHYERHALTPSVNLSYRLNLDWAKIVDAASILTNSKRKLLQRGA